MTKNDIVEYLYRTKVVEKLSKKYTTYITTNKHNQVSATGSLEDFVQHIYLCILSIPESKLIELYKSSQLVYYVYYIIKAQATNRNSKYHTIHNSKMRYEDIEIENSI